MARSLLVCSVAFLLLFAALYVERLRLGRLTEEVAVLQEQAARLENAQGSPA